MDTLIVGTDFSPAADNALLYAAALARSLRLQLQVIHVYDIPATMNDMPAMMVSGEELQRLSDESLNRSLERLRRDFGDLTFSGESRLGSVTDEMNDACRKEKAFALVVGSHPATGFERMVFGSSATALLRHAVCPVIAVPEAATFTPLQQVLLATDLASGAPLNLAPLRQLLQASGARLHLVHVRTGEEGPKEAAAKEALVRELADLQPAYLEITNEDLTEGLNDAVRQTGAELLVCIPHHHSVLEHLFFKTHSEAVLQKAPVPVLFLPEERP
ncbi:MAG TPA: universal stress protein [Chitinophagaceae bacterium]|jgi:nucleotide-binding universal stress UspA family protein|nr:universal stress protein [Chitinophagaceae bacterium]